MNDTPAFANQNSGELKVCQIIASFHPIVGGAEMATWRLSRELRTRGLDVVVLTRRQPGLSARDRIGPLSLYRAGHPSRSKVGALTFILHGLWILGTRFRDYRLLHVQSLDSPLLLGMLAKLILRRKLLATDHSQRRLNRARTSPVGEFRIHLMRRLVDRFTALTPDMRGQLCENGVKPWQVELIPNAVNTNLYQPPTSAERLRARTHLELDESELVVLSVGRLVGVKGMDVLVRAWASIPDRPATRLLLVGDGPERRPLERLATQLQADRIRFEGSRDDVLAYLRAADLFVLPSRHEGLSVALLEAMAVALPSIVTDLPGNRVLVRHEESGLVVPVDDPDSLGQQLSRLLIDSPLRARLGKAARAVVVERYGLSVVAERYEDLYRSMICN